MSGANEPMPFTGNLSPKTRNQPLPLRRRLALCVLPALLAAGAVLAPAASADVPNPPRLNSTNPPSPGTSLTPLVQGTVDGGITRRAVGIDRAAGTDAVSVFVINIYTNPTCSGAPAATGSGDELEGPGIAVTVLPD